MSQLGFDPSFENMVSCHTEELFFTPWSVFSNLTYSGKLISSLSLNSFWLKHASPYASHVFFFCKFHMVCLSKPASIFMKDPCSSSDFLFVLWSFWKTSKQIILGDLHKLGCESIPSKKKDKGILVDKNRIYCMTLLSVYFQRLRDCFVVSQLISVARYFKLGSKPGKVYVCLIT